MKWLHLVLAVVLATSSAAPAFAQHAAAPSPTPAASPEPETPVSEDAVTHHTLVLGGKPYAYTARAGTITLRNQDDEPTARIFYVAYTLDGVAAESRPVTFMYNGGPGSSTMWLHMGSFSPVRIETSNGQITPPAPYHLVPNNMSLIDKTDMVFIDMPDSGFGRILGVGKPADFFGVDKDVEAFAQFIQRYLTKFSRWNSPKFLYGESYGTTRSAALVDYLQNAGVSMNGVVLQSSILNFGVDGSDIGGNDWPYILYLPTEAATAWYHHALPNPSATLDAFLPQVESFAMGEFADALSKGSTVSASEYDDVVRKLHRYTGLSEQYIRNSNLRFTYDRFENELLRNQGIVIGRLDGRFTTLTTDRLQNEPPWDPTDAAIDAPFTAAVNSYLRQDLNYHTPLTYRTMIYDIIGDSWDFKHRGIPTTNVLPDLSEAMTYNPNLRIFSANGYYDFATPFFETVYSLDHLSIEPSLRANITYGFYQSGHMIYLEPQALQQLHDDLERWYDATLGGHS